MIVIGELINGTRKQVAEAISARDADFIAELARDQELAGAHYIDCNPGTVGEREVDDIVWLVQTVQTVSDRPLSFDTPNPAAMQAAFDTYNGATKPLINSITGERERIEKLLPLVVSSEASVIAMALNDEGMPSSTEKSYNNAIEIIDTLIEAGVRPELIHVDPVIAPLGVDCHTGQMVLEAIQLIRQARPDVHITCGLSNISYGLPERRLLNRVFIAQAIAAGLDSAILDPLDAHMMATIYAAEALAGRDEFCMNYITASREGKLSEFDL